MKYINVATFAMIGIVVFMFACNSNKDENKKYLIQTKFEKGVKYYFTSIVQSKTNINANNKQIEKISNTETSFIYELINDSAGYKQLKITYDAFKATIKKDDQVEEIDMSNNLDFLNPVNKFISKLKGLSVVAYIDNKGKLLELKGYEELTNILLSSQEINDPKTRQMFQQKLYALIGEGLVKNSLEQGLGFFPDSAIAVGSKWQKQIAQKAEINLTFNNNYIFDEVKDNTAYLISKADINSENNPINVMGMNVTSSLNGKQTASYKIDIKTGLVIEGKTKTFIEGNIQVMNKEVPITIETTTTISSRKM